MSNDNTPQKEEDVPKDNYAIDATNETSEKEKDRDWFNTIKGHNLLGWCVALVFIIYLIEFIWNKNKMSDISKDIIEILKLLIFSLTGYLFGTSTPNNKK